MAQQTVTFKGKEYKLDRHGFLDRPDQWDEDFAEGMAQLMGIHAGLTDDHWTFIRYLREKYLNEKSIPVVVHACSDNKLRLGQLRTLFPTGYHRGACRIAGINYAFMSETNIWLTYESKPAPGTDYRVDDLGFLREFQQWDEGFAHWVVRNWNLPDGLTDAHWKVIFYLREFFRRSGTIPSIFDVCRSNRIDLDEFGRLFPRGYRRGACRAAGLPFYG